MRARMRCAMEAGSSGGDARVELVLGRRHLLRLLLLLGLALPAADTALLPAGFHTRVETLLAVQPDRGGLGLAV